LANNVHEFLFAVEVILFTALDTSYLIDTIDVDFVGLKTLKDHSAEHTLLES